MQKYYIDGKEVSVIEKTEHKLKQLNEAETLIQEFLDRLSWADDFAHYASIRQALDGPYSATDQALDDLQNQISEIETQLTELKEKRNAALIETEQEFEGNVRYALQ